MFQVLLSRSDAQDAGWTALISDTSLGRDLLEVNIGLIEAGSLQTPDFKG